MADKKEGKMNLMYLLALRENMKNRVASYEYSPDR